jgi:DnaJ-class molecular chaperone
MEFKDYYKILGVEPDADAKTIKTVNRPGFVGGSIS